MEYKFRGKRKDNGEWVEGYYVAGNIEITGGDFPQEEYRHFIVPLFDIESQIEVHPASIGMFTGLTDKNGKEIYSDSDIFKFKYLEELNRPVELTGVFVFGSDLSFEIDVFGSENYTCLHYIGNGQFYDFEIVGNIHEGEKK